MEKKVESEKPQPKKRYECLNCKALLDIRIDADFSKYKCCRKPDLRLIFSEEDTVEKNYFIQKILRRPNLFNEIVEIELSKRIEGELATRKVIFLCANGRLVENSQTASYNLLVNDEAGAGKDYVVGETLEILPKEIYIHKTRISPTVFTYWHREKEWSWNGKVFYPEDISEMVLNSDVFKVMTSRGSSAIITVKHEAVEIEIHGKPVMITTTASAVPNPELVRRFVILNLDSSESQTKAVMKRHSKFKKEGIIPEYDSEYTKAMRYLQRVKVRIPFADLIDEFFPSRSNIMRTHYPRFLDFISASAAFHQYQREKDEDGFILAEKQDYEIAKECFLKLCSNKYMIPLTINQRKILKAFEEQPFLKGSASILHASKMSFLSLPSLQTNLGLLVKYGILEIQSSIDSLNREVEVYSLAQGYNINEKLELPEFKELQINLSNLNNNNNLSNLSNLSNSENKGVTKVIKVIKAKKGINNSQKCSKCGDPEAFISTDNGVICEKCYKEQPK